MRGCSQPVTIPLCHFFLPILLLPVPVWVLPMDCGSFRTNLLQHGLPRLHRGVSAQVLAAPPAVCEPAACRADSHTLSLTPRCWTAFGPFLSTVTGALPAPLTVPAVLSPALCPGMVGTGCNRGSLSISTQRPHNPAASSWAQGPDTTCIFQ